MLPTCFAFLDLKGSVVDDLLAQKCYQISRAFTTKLFPKAPMFQSNDYDEILAWADRTRCDFLFIQSPGTVLWSPSAVQSCIQLSREFDSTIIGEYEFSASMEYPGIKPRAILVNLVLWRKMKKPKWGMPDDMINVRMPYQTWDSPDLLANSGIIATKTLSMPGGNIISKSMEGFSAIRAIPDAFYRFASFMEVHDHQEGISKALNDFVYYNDELDLDSMRVLGAMYDEVLEGVTVKLFSNPSPKPLRIRSLQEARKEHDNDSQLSISLEFSMDPRSNVVTSTTPGLNASIPIVHDDSRIIPRIPPLPQQSQYRQSIPLVMQSTQSPYMRCRKLQVEISKLYSIPSGFRPLEILMEHGFNSDTEVIYFARSTAELTFRQVLLEDWNGTNFHKFAMDYSDMYRLDTPRMDIAEAWQNTLETFGGAKEFRDLWNAYKKLRHHYTFIKRENHYELAIEDGPGVYVYWDDFCSNHTIQYHQTIGEAADNFTWFYSDLLKQNPHALLEGLDNWGRPVCNHLKQCV